MKKCMTSMVIMIWGFFLLTGAEITPIAVAKEALKKDLHQALEKKIGTDVNVEDYVKAIDHLAHGEIDQAKGILVEQAVFRSLGMALGVFGAELIEGAWKFDKWVWDSCQKWADTQDKKAFFEQYLEPRIKDWIAREKIPDWRQIRGDPRDPRGSYGSIEQWFYNHNTQRTKLFADRALKSQQLKQELWIHTRWIMGKMNWRFRQKRALEIAARNANAQINERLDNYEKVAEEVIRRLREAGIEVDMAVLAQCVRDPEFFEQLLSKWKPVVESATKQPSRNAESTSPVLEKATIAGGWTVMRKNLYWKWDWEDDYWVIGTKEGKVTILDVDKSCQCVGRMSGREFTGKWVSALGQYITTLRFSPDGRSFKGETNFKLLRGGKGKELLKGEKE